MLSFRCKDRLHSILHVIMLPIQILLCYRPFAPHFSTSFSQCTNLHLLPFLKHNTSSAALVSGNNPWDFMFWGKKFKWDTHSPEILVFFNMFCLLLDPCGNPKGDFQVLKHARYLEVWLLHRRWFSGWEDMGRSRKFSVKVKNMFVFSHLYTPTFDNSVFVQYIKGKNAILLTY